MGFRQFARIRKNKMERTFVFDDGGAFGIIKPRKQKKKRGKK